MKKRLALIVCLACALCLCMGALAGCGGDTKKETTKKAFDGTLIVGFDNAFPPYGYVDEKTGKNVGFDLDVAKLVCEKLGWKYSEEAIAWDSKDTLLNSGEINCIWNGFTMEGRENDYAMSDPYLNNTQVVMVKSDSGIKSLADLKGKTVLVQNNSAAYNYLSPDGEYYKGLGDTFKSLETIGDYQAAFMQLESGVVDAIAMDEGPAQTLVKDGYTILSEPICTEHYAVAFAKGDEELAKQVTQALRDLNAEGKIQPLCEQYGVNYNSWLL